MKNIQNLKTFIVDNDPNCAMAYKQHLKLNGFTDVTCFTDYEYFMNQLAQQPAIVFWDLQNVKPFDNIEILKKIKWFNPNIYVIIVANQNEVPITIDTLKQEAFDYIVKGDNAIDMINVVLCKIIETVKMSSIKPIRKWYKPLWFPIFSATSN